MPERLYTAYQVTNLLGVTLAEVVGWMQRGRLVFQRLPDGAVRIPGKALIRFLKREGIDLETIVAKFALREEEPMPAGDLHEQTLRLPVTEGVSEGFASTSPSSGQTEDAASQVAEAILRNAVAKRVSGVHLESRQDGLALRVRIDGTLHDKVNFKARLPKALAPQLIAHFKSLAGVDAEERQRPQTGCFRSNFDGREVTFHLATCPALHGEKLLIHVLDPAAAPSLSQIGLSSEDESLIRDLSAQPAGMILAAGPPRSGRATTLRAILRELNTRQRDIVAIEKYAHIELEGINQSQVNLEVGFGFAEAVRAFGRQDPDVIMVEDIRDPQTARAALEVATDGRMVLGAVSARNCSQAMKMMLEADVERWPLASVLLAIVAHRTVRKLCGECKSQVEPSSELTERLRRCGQEVNFPVQAGRGCDCCSNTGYSGETGLFSIMHVNETIASLIRQGAEAKDIELVAVRSGMRHLGQVGLEKVRSGETSLEEILRIFAPPTPLCTP